MISYMVAPRCFSDKWGVHFVPTESGVHYVHVRLNGQHVPGSPYPVQVGGGDADAGKVRAYGDGLVKGQTGEFTPLYFLKQINK